MLLHYSFLWQDREDFELRSKIIRQLLADHGQALVHVTVNACIFCLPWYMVADVSEMLYELMLADRTVRQWDAVRVDAS